MSCAECEGMTIVMGWSPSDNKVLRYSRSDIGVSENVKGAHTHESALQSRVATTDCLGHERTNAEYRYVRLSGYTRLMGASRTLQ